MKANFKTLVLSSDTDSLIYEIESKDLYEDLKNNDAVCQDYDFSNYNGRQLAALQTSKGGNTQG